MMRDTSIAACLRMGTDQSFLAMILPDATKLKNFAVHEFPTVRRVVQKRRRF